LISAAELCVPGDIHHSEEFLHFIEEDEFRSDWQSLGLNIESDLWDLQNVIMAAPTAAPVIAGTAGVRKLRFAPEGWNRGKRGAVRVIYVYFPEHWIVLLLMAYQKGRKESIASAERKALKQYVERIQRYLDERRRQ
jgi:hypothetical protein